MTWGTWMGSKARPWCPSCGKYCRRHKYRVQDFGLAASGWRAWAGGCHTHSQHWFLPSSLTVATTEPELWGRADELGALLQGLFCLVPWSWCWSLVFVGGAVSWAPWQQWREAVPCQCPPAPQCLLSRNDQVEHLLSPKNINSCLHTHCKKYCLGFPYDFRCLYNMYNVTFICFNNYWCHH